MSLSLNSINIYLYFTAKQQLFPCKLPEINVILITLQQAEHTQTGRPKGRHIDRRQDEATPRRLSTCLAENLNKFICHYVQSISYRPEQSRPGLNWPGLAWHRQQNTNGWKSTYTQTHTHTQWPQQQPQQINKQNKHLSCCIDAKNVLQFPTGANALLPFYVLWILAISPDRYHTRCWPHFIYCQHKAPCTNWPKC